MNESLIRGGALVFISVLAISTFGYWVLLEISKDGPETKPTLRVNSVTSTIIDNSGDAGILSMSVIVFHNQDITFLGGKVKDDEGRNMTGIMTFAPENLKKEDSEVQISYTLLPDVFPKPGHYLFQIDYFFDNDEILRLIEFQVTFI